MSGKRSRSETLAFLSALRARGIHIRAEDEVLRCNAPRGALTVDLRDELARRKREILDLLRPAAHSLVEVQPRGSRPPLFGVHSTRYRTLSEHLGQDQPIYALRYGLAQASDSARVLPERIEDLAAHYVDEMRRVQPEGPYRLMGLCIGGHIAYEMALRLLAAGEQVALLALFDALGPNGRIALPVGERVRNLLRVGPGGALGRMRERARLRFAPGDEGEVRGESARVKYRSYAPRHPIACAVDVFRPADRLSITHRFPDDLGWGALVREPLTVHAIPGEDHTAMFREPCVGVVAERLRECLEGRREPAPQPSRPGAAEATAAP